MKNIKYILIFWIFIFVGTLNFECAAQEHVEEQELTFVMGYRENAKFPYISALGDDSGFYNDLFSLAAKKMGAKFRIERKPKVRIMNEIKEGKIDFYPGLTFGTERTKFIYFMVRGLPGGDVGLSLKSLPEITDMCELEGKLIIQALGGSDLAEQFKQCNLNIKKISALDTERAAIMLRRGRADFYIYNRPTIEVYVYNNPSDDLRVHYTAFGERKDYFAGFSRASSKYEEEANPDYDPIKEISPYNLPYRIKTDCPAYRFEKIIRDLVESGEVERLYQKNLQKK